MKKSLKIKIIVVFFIILMLFLIYTKIKEETDVETISRAKITSLFEKVDNSKLAKISKYIIYGTHFNLEGTVEIPSISGIKIYSANVVIKNINGEENALNCTYDYNDGLLSFSTTDKINDGLYLENLSNSNYYIFLKVILSNSEVKYYSLENNSKYDNITYFTLTKDNSNNRVDIKFDTYNNISFMGISVSPTDKLPDNVYDIAIDPGHGGNDSGAKNNGYSESDLVLDCAKILKQNLENSGYKVFLTRDGTEAKDEPMDSNMYDENGRINIACESCSKLLLSLHINSNSTKLSKGGVEIYAPSNCNLNFAKLLAENIVKTANTSYSSLSTYKEDDGVYVHNFSNAEILAFKSRAILGKYEPYNITNSTPFLYIIRETGGIATNAFVDGRNKNYGTNKYYNSNVGIETYDIELGYMNIDKDLNNILKNKNLYMTAISDSINKFYK